MSDILAGIKAAVENLEISRLKHACEHVAKLLKDLKYSDGSSVYLTVREEFVPTPRAVPVAFFPCAIVYPQRTYLNGAIVRSIVPFNTPKTTEEQLLKIKNALWLSFELRGSFHYSQDSNNNLYREYFVAMSVERAENL